MAALTRAIANRRYPNDRLEAFRLAVEKLAGGDRRREAVAALFGLDATCRWKREDRWNEAARLLKYKNGESLRKTKERGRGQLNVIYDDLISELMVLADREGFRYEPSSPGPETAPVPVVKKFYPIPDQISARRWDGEAVSWLPTDMPEEVRASIENSMADICKCLLQTSSGPSLMIGSSSDEYVDYYPHWNQLN